MKTVKEVVPDVVVVAQAKDHSINLMMLASQKLSALGVKKVLFVGLTPQWTGDLPKIMARQLWLIKPTRTFVGINKTVRDINTHYLRECATHKLECVDVIGLFCNERGCLTHTSDDIRESLTTWDYGHLTPSASQYLAKFLLVDRIVGRE